jgi:hypothetical protein
MTTPGKRLVALLNEGLPKGVAWDADERVVLTLIEDSADCAESLRTLLAAELAKPEVSAHRCCELAGEIRQLRASIAKMAASLDPEMETAKSLRHVHAANSRWRNHGA